MKYILLLFISFLLILGCQKTPLEPEKLPVINTNEEGEITVDYTTYEGTWTGIDVHTSEIAQFICSGYSFIRTNGVITVDTNIIASEVYIGTYSITNYVVYSATFIDADLDLLVTNATLYTNNIAQAVLSNTNISWHAIVRLSNDILYMAIGHYSRPTEYKYIDVSNNYVEYFIYDTFTQ